MLYNAVCHANFQSVIRYPYPIRIRGIVENDIRIRKNSRISANIYPRTSAPYRVLLEGDSNYQVGPSRSKSDQVGHTHYQVGTYSNSNFRAK